MQLLALRYLSPSSLSPLSSLHLALSQPILLPISTQPCSVLLWSAALGRDWPGQRQPESTGRPQASCCPSQGLSFLILTIDTSKLSPALILGRRPYNLPPISPHPHQPSEPTAHTKQTSDLVLSLGNWLLHCTCLPNTAIDMIQSFRSCCENSSSATTNLPSWAPWQEPSRDSQPGPGRRASRTSQQRPTESFPFWAVHTTADSQLFTFGPRPSGTHLPP